MHTTSNIQHHMHTGDNILARTSNNVQSKHSTRVRARKFRTSGCLKLCADGKGRKAESAEMTGDRHSKTMKSSMI